MTFADILCDFVPVFMMKTGCMLAIGGSVFDWKIMEIGVFILGIIMVIIKSKINKFLNPIP